MKISKQARRQAKQLFRSCLAGGLVNESRARNAVDEILTSRPRGFVAILSHFRRLLELDAERHAAHIESAVPLSPELQATIKANLQKRYGPGLNFRFSQTTDLLGGVRVHVGSDVYDGSIRGRLAQVQAAFESA
jgi:F-type H+-transporting ATPase subunit delta